MSRCVAFFAGISSCPERRAGSGCDRRDLIPRMRCEDASCARGGSTVDRPAEPVMPHERDRSLNANICEPSPISATQRSMRITVLGAGYMGSAMATVAKMRGHDVRFWGPRLDAPMLDPASRGEPHPRLKLTLDGIAIFRSSALADALAAAEIVVCGV